jgi:N6-L-threonylcarbamoyladenine synthase
MRETSWPPYPGGPHVDKLAAEGDPEAFAFAKPVVKDLDVSFSGLKTSFLYFLQDKIKTNPEFIEQNLNNLCASLQKSITDILVSKLVAASKLTGINEICLAGGVSANAGLRKAVQRKGDEMGWKVYFPEIRYTTDNAAMIAVAGYYKYLEGGFSGYDVVPVARAGQL